MKNKISFAIHSMLSLLLSLSAQAVTPQTESVAKSAQGYVLEQKVTSCKMIAGPGVDGSISVQVLTNVKDMPELKMQFSNAQVPFPMGTFVSLNQYKLTTNNFDNTYNFFWFGIFRRTPTPQGYDLEYGSISIGTDAAKAFREWKLIREQVVKGPGNSIDRAPVYNFTCIFPEPWEK